ncbi:hypothetical protein [Noviherbaspirillum sp.]|uniref:hypothetical protein n=1 Tax=Noviherbaspirillum sp. TaxID=1926288 RepID=UPI002B4AA17B|nr:hypothetical protein [Noviherbaspirillum sp.]HJV79446.1 hypothetical protein [Noviherbaspirillum sp.]
MQPRLRKFSSLALSIGFALLLAACGGGGSSGSPGSSTQAASTITSANASDVAAQAYAASDALNSQAVAGGTAGADLVTAVSVQTPMPTTGLIDAGLQQMYRVLAHKPADMVLGVMGTGTITCSGGGMMTGSYNMMNANMVSNGDTLTVTSSGCREGMHQFNGGLTIAFSNISGLPSSMGAWNATMRMTLNNFSVMQNNITETANGDISLNYGQNLSGTRAFTVSGSSLQMSTTRGGAMVTRMLTNYSYDASVTSANLYTYRCDYTLTGDLPRIGNNVSYTVRTMTPFQQQGGLYPNQGVMTVRASDGTSLTMTVRDATSVQIAIDRNGDGIVDETIVKTWTELSALI